MISKSPAKINIHLGVGKLREDGYHELTTVYQAISLYDVISVVPDKKIIIRGGGPENEKNLAWQAVRELAEIMDKSVPTLRIEIEKNIPIAGGLAGGSSDAAAVLKLMGKEWNASPEQLELAAMRVGSDVPFLLHGGTCLGTGRGEIIIPILSRGQYHWVVVMDEGQLSTPQVYQELDRIRREKLLPESVQAGPPDQLISALTKGQAELLAPYVTNDLQVAAISLMPKLRKTLNAGMQIGALAGIVSGSGPSCVFLAENASHAAELVTAFTAKSSMFNPQAIKIATGPVPGAHIVND